MSSFLCLCPEKKSTLSAQMTVILKKTTAMLQLCVLPFPCNDDCAICFSHSSPQRMGLCAHLAPVAHSAKLYPWSIKRTSVGTLKRSRREKEKTASLVNLEVSKQASRDLSAKGTFAFSPPLPSLILLASVFVTNGPTRASSQERFSSSTAYLTNQLCIHSPRRLSQRTSLN